MQVFGKDSMHKSLLDILVDPISKASLDLEIGKQDEKGEIIEGVLSSREGNRYCITSGIPRFTAAMGDDQSQTAGSFAFKWQKQDTYDSPQVHEVLQKWLVDRYGFASVDEIAGFFASRRRILDAGCGGGLTTLLWMSPSWRRDGDAEWFGVDISEAIDVAQQRLGCIEGVHFIQGDILQLPFGCETFDAIFSEGVLHHTPSTEAALKTLIPLLKTGGEFLFYVYRKKGPIREFTDDYIRSFVSVLEPREAWDVLRAMTKLGRALSELRADVEVPEDIPCLGIKAGRYDVQRLVYWHFAKLYWREEFSFEQNNHVNFDWYHPRYAHRHTEEEIRSWCIEAGLSIFRFNVQESGFTVRAVKA